jgi:hypothetical protein
MKGLPIILFKTLIISVIVAIAANCIYYVIITQSADRDYTHAVPLIMQRTFSLGIIIAVMSLPMLFLFNPNYWNHPLGRLALYFAGPVMFIIAVFYVSTNPVTKTSDLLTGAVFLIVTSIFYYRLTRKSQTNTTHSTRK